MCSTGGGVHVGERLGGIGWSSFPMIPFILSSVSVVSETAGSSGISRYKDFLKMFY